MRIVLAAVIVIASLFMVTVVWYAATPAYFGIMDTLDGTFTEWVLGDVWSNVSGVLRNTWWWLLLLFVGVFMVWFFLMAQRKDYESTEYEARP